MVAGHDQSISSHYVDAEGQENGFGRIALPTSEEEGPLLQSSQHEHDSAHWIAPAGFVWIQFGME